MKGKISGRKVGGGRLYKEGSGYGEKKRESKREEEEEEEEEIDR